MQEREGSSRWRQEPQDWYQPAPLWWLLVNANKWDSRLYGNMERISFGDLDSRGQHKHLNELGCRGYLAEWMEIQGHGAKRGKVVLLQGNHLKVVLAMLRSGFSGFTVELDLHPLSSNKIWLYQLSKLTCNWKNAPNLLPSHSYTARNKINRPVQWNNLMSYETVYWMQRQQMSNDAVYISVSRLLWSHMNREPSL